MNFQPISVGKELPEVTFEPISTADRNLIWQAWFRFLIFVFRLAVYKVSIVGNMRASTGRTGLTSVRQKSNLCVIDPQLCVIRNTEHDNTTFIPICFIGIASEGYIVKSY